MLNIVIPMAGRGSRFQKEGYTLPKPLIPVCGIPMIELVISNLRPKRKHQFIFLCLKDHVKDYQVESKLNNWAPGSQIVYVEHVTEGAACTVLLAKKIFNNQNSLMIANSDQWVNIDINDYLSVMDDNDLDGLIMTMSANDPKWSYIRLDRRNIITEVLEKQVVSNEATVGIYNYKYGVDFVNAAEDMIRKNLRVNNEFYVAPTYNQMIKIGKRIGYYNVGKEADGMYGLGIPADLKLFESLDVSQKAVYFAVNRDKTI